MSRGGSRCGAGRPATHGKAEHCRSLDVRRWQREGMLKAGRSGAWEWTDSDTGKRLAAIGYRSDGTSMALDYSIDGGDRSQRVSLSFSACRYGGTRPWFICPIRFERVAVLYLRAGRFACRHCQQLRYASQSNDALGRTWRRQHKVERTLGEDCQRPTGMHRTTYERLLSIITDCEERRDAALRLFLGGLMARHPSLRSDPVLRGLR